MLQVRFAKNHPIAYFLSVFNIKLVGCALNFLPEWRQIYMLENRRQFPRVHANKKISVLTDSPGIGELEGTITDIGQGGSKIFVSEPLELKSKICIAGMRYDHAAVTAIVQRITQVSDAQYEIGVQFLAENQTDFYSDVIENENLSPTPLKRGPVPS